MSATPEEWNDWLSRRSAAPAQWLQALLNELQPHLSREASIQEREWSAADLRQHDCFGRCDVRGYLGDDGLKDWEAGVQASLRRDDVLWISPSGELPLLVREFAQWLDLPGFDAVGARPNEDAQVIGWQKNLTAQGCTVYRWERDNQITAPKDWVPRVRWAGAESWPEADNVQLPIFFVTRNSEGQQQGLNGWLRLWLWPCDGAQLEFLPSVPQRVQPLADSWVRGLQQANQWIRRQLQGQGGEWKNHALVWDVYTADHTPYSLLQGASASAAFALAGLWLARHSAPQHWAGSLSRLRRDDWLRARITAAIGNGESAADLLSVGGVEVKNIANWVLNQGSAQRQSPLRVAKDQTFSIDAPGQPMPQFIEYASAHDLLKALAHDALDLGNTSLGPLLGALQPALHHFAPDPATSAEGMAAARHLPRLETAWRAPMADRAWQALVSRAAADRLPSTTLEAFALRRWATLAQEQHEGGSVNCLFVNLSVDEKHRPRQRRNGGPYSLDQLMAEYEQDSECPDHEVQALMLVGAPGGGKTWLLQRFEQACAERLLWQLDQQRRRSEPDGAAADTLALLDVPLYVSLSGLPTRCKFDDADAIVSWFCTQVLGSPNAPDSRLQRRLLRPESEKGLRLRIILDGLNEVKVTGAEDRASRVKGVVRALSERLQPGLPMLLGTRTHHRYELDHTSAIGQRFNVAVAELNPWAPAQMEGYLRKRWAGQEHAHLRDEIPALMDKINSNDSKGPGERLREVLSLPLYLRVQCELLEAGARELLDSRARLLAALLWRNLHKEFIQKSEEGKDRADPGLFTEQERAIAQRFHDNPDQDPPAFPRKGRLLQGLFAVAWAMWLANPDEPVQSRGKVALPLYDGREQGDGKRGASVSIEGVLSGLGWPKRQLRRLITQWTTLARELGWLTVDEASATARFAHQAYGEFLASQQLFWKARHAGWTRHPQPQDWTEGELQELAGQLAPPAPARSCLEELEPSTSLKRLWDEVPRDLLERWRREGVAAPSIRVRTVMSRSWGESTLEASLLTFFREGLIIERGDALIWNLQLYGNYLNERGVFSRCDSDRPWMQQPLAWALMSRHSGLWHPFRAAMHQALEDRLGPFVADVLFSENGRLPEAPAGDMDEIVLLAIGSQSDPFSWMRALLEIACQTTVGSSKQRVHTRQTGCWALLSRTWVQERQRLQRSRGQEPDFLAWQRDLSRLLLSINQAADLELMAASLPGELVWTHHKLSEVGPHDLRHRLQAGYLLGQQGSLGSDAGDHERYERKVSERDTRVSGVRLRHKYWNEVASADSGVTQFLVARYPVTVGEFQSFVEAGGYHTPDATWWLQGMAPRQSGARMWLRRALNDPRVADRRSIDEGPFCGGRLHFRESNLHPMVNVNFYEATAYAHWASEYLYSDWIAELRRVWGGAEVKLRLLNSGEWNVLRELARGSRWLSSSLDKYLPLMSNNLTTGLWQTSPVGSFSVSQYSCGLFDLDGNVREWSCSWDDEEEMQMCSASIENDWKCRELYGSSFLHVKGSIGRSSEYPDESQMDIGFRLGFAMEL